MRSPICCCGVTVHLMIASVKQNGSMKVQQEVARACPKCGSEMVLRVVK